MIMMAKGRSETDDIDDDNDSGGLFRGISSIPRGAKTNIQREMANFFLEIFHFGVRE